MGPCENERRQSEAGDKNETPSNGRPPRFRQRAISEADLERGINAALTADDDVAEIGIGKRQ